MKGCKTSPRGNFYRTCHQYVRPDVLYATEWPDCEGMAAFFVPKRAGETETSNFYA